MQLSQTITPSQGQDNVCSLSMVTAETASEFQLHCALKKLSSNQMASICDFEGYFLPSLSSAFIATISLNKIEKKQKAEIIIEYVTSQTLEEDQRKKNK